MKYKADFKISENSKKLYDCVSNEIRNDERTNICFDLKNDILGIYIECKDAVALRAACNSITRLISVFSSAAKAGRKDDEEH